MASTFDQVPSGATIHPESFQISIPEPKLQLMSTLISISPIGPPTYENQTADPATDYGVKREWLQHAKQVWEHDFDWRKREEYLNSFPHFTVPIHDQQADITVTVHFVALFSKKLDAVPLAMYHGWPGSFLEHLDTLSLLRTRYTPETLPYHVIVPSLTGFAFSSGPPLDKDFDGTDQARILDQLMRGLFGETGYLAHGGDMGHLIALRQAVESDACKGVHINNLFMPPPENEDELEVSELEKSVLHKGQEFLKTGIAYAIEHGTRPATIGLALSASPVALLAWIGEKFISWSDEDPPIERILDSVSLYYLTDTFPRSIWNYRGFLKGVRKWPQIDKPVGYSFFAGDLAPIPASWFKTFANVIWHQEHSSGGHFPGFEKPRELLDDLESFVKVAWKA